MFRQHTLKGSKAISGSSNVRIKNLNKHLRDHIATIFILVLMKPPVQDVHLIRLNLQPSPLSISFDKAEHIEELFNKPL